MKNKLVLQQKFKGVKQGGFTLYIQYQEVVECEGDEFKVGDELTPFDFIDKEKYDVAVKECQP